jgi:hypothetical protein
MDCLLLWERKYSTPHHKRTDKQHQVLSDQRRMIHSDARTNRRRAELRKNTEAPKIMKINRKRKKEERKFIIAL